MTRSTGFALSRFGGHDDAKAVEERIKNTDKRMNFMDSSFVWPTFQGAEGLLRCRQWFAALTLFPFVYVKGRPHYAPQTNPYEDIY
jgi:hypothetical protein